MRDNNFNSVDNKFNIKWVIMNSSATIEDIIDKIQILSIVPPTWPEDLITENSKIPYRNPPKGLVDDIVGNSRIPKTKNTSNFSGVLGPQGFRA